MGSEEPALNMDNTKRSFMKKAFRIIRRNYGCPGNDGISIGMIRKNYEIHESIIWERLKNGNFLFEKNPKNTTIKDYLGKNRDIYVYNVGERWVQEFLRLQIEPVLDTFLAEYAYAFRRKKSDLGSYKYILKNNPNFILRLDIENYFNSIHKENLLTSLAEIGLKKEILKLVEKSLNHCEKGLPLGHVLSPLLSNFNLKNFDAIFPKNYTRYSDDMMFALSDAREVQGILASVKKLLKSYGFSLNSAKMKLIMNPTLEKLS